MLLLGREPSTAPLDPQEVPAPSVTPPTSQPSAAQVAPAVSSGEAGAAAQGPVGSPSPQRGAVGLARAPRHAAEQSAAHEDPSVEEIQRSVPPPCLSPPCLVRVVRVQDDVAEEMLGDEEVDAAESQELLEAAIKATQLAKVCDHPFIGYLSCDFSLCALC